VNEEQHTYFLRSAGMNLRNIITFTILLLFVSAIGLLFFPSKMLAVVGITGNDELDFLLRTTGAGVASLIPGAWAVRSAVVSRVSRAVLIGLVVYLFLSSIVDFFDYKLSIVNTAAIPSIVFRIILGIVIFLLMRKETGTH
jgi:hypothetical protein